MDPYSPVELRCFQYPYVLPCEKSVLQQVLGALLPLCLIVLSHGVRQLHRMPKFGIHVFWGLFYRIKVLYKLLQLVEA